MNASSATHDVGRKLTEPLGGNNNSPIIWAVKIECAKHPEENIEWGLAGAYAAARLAGQ
jgi:hypothetical protein